MGVSVSGKSQGLSLSEFVDRAVRRDQVEPGVVFREKDEVFSPRRKAPRHATPDRISRMFQSPTGQKLVSAVGNESRSVAVMGVYAAELASGLIALADRGAETASVREIAVFGRDHTTDLLVLVPGGPSKGEPRAAGFSAASVGEVWSRLARRVETSSVADYSALLLELGEAGAMDALEIIDPRIVLARAPRMERLSALWPPVDVAFGDESSTAGILARDERGRSVVTMAAHATGNVGEVVTIDGHTATIADRSEIFDTSYAECPPGLTMHAVRGRAGPMAKRPPARGEAVQFFGARSQLVSTVVEGVDLGIPRVDPRRMRCVQTRRDTNPGDSGAALVNTDDEVVGFCYSRTAYDEPMAFADWVWAKSVYDVLKLQPLQGGLP